MSLGDFNLNNKESKAITNPEATGLGAGGSEIQHVTPRIPTFMVNVKESSVHNSDVERTFTGPFAGTGGGSGGATNAEDSHGFNTPTGNKIHINGAAGSESIEIVHHTGAAIMIDADGAIFIMPSGRKGFGLSAAQGDGVINAAQRIVIKGNGGITLETDGNLEMNVGQHLYMDVGGDFKLNVDGATTISSDGTYNLECTKDVIETIGGIKRAQVAGDVWTQSAGYQRHDAGKTFEVRANDDVKVMSQRAIELQAKEASAFEVDTGGLNLNAKDDVHLSSEKSIYTVSKEDTIMESNQNLAFRTKGNAIISSPGSLHFDVSNNIDMRANNVSLSAANNFIIYGDEFTLNAANSYHLKADQDGYIDADSALLITTLSTNISSLNRIDLRTLHYHTYPPMVSTADAAAPETSTATPAYPLPIEITDPRATPTIFSPKEAEFPDAKTIINSMTTEVEAPDFPANAAKMNAKEMSRYQNEGGQPNPKALARAQPNQGAGSPSKMGESSGAIPTPSNQSYEGVTSSAVGEKNPYPLPSSLQNASDKISRNVTVGMLPGLARCPVTQMGLSRQQILQNSAHLAYNVIDPILAKFGNKLRITDHLRIGTGGSRHFLGKAVDMASAAFNFAETAECAAWVRDNVAFDRLFLEANNAGTVHMHIEAAPEGQKGARTVWTCSDPHCNGRTDGLQLAFAVAGLKKMGFA